MKNTNANELAARYHNGEITLFEAVSLFVEDLMAHYPGQTEKFDYSVVLKRKPKN